MEVRKPSIKSLPYDEFKDNESLEKIVDELHEGGVNVVTGNLELRYRVYGVRLFALRLLALRFRGNA